MKPKRNRALLILAALLLAAVFGILRGPSLRATPGNTSDLQEHIKNVTGVLAIVQQNYAIPVDTDRALYEGAIPGMLRVLDPHSTFFDPRQYALIREGQRGKYYGVGMTIGVRENHTVVLAPMVGSPASKAGIRPGDVINTIDGKSADGLTTSEVADLLKGPKGTTVHVSMIREGEGAPVNFTLTRDEIPRHAVDLAFLVRPGIGYVRLTGFESEDADSDIAAALKQLDVAKLDGLILDLRGNPGGLLDKAVAIADMFLDKNQLIVSHHGRASQERRYYAVHGNRGVQVPLVVLVNGGSASASEILSGAVQDHDRGLVLGEQTFGKGLVQSVTPLSENTGLALTTARYYTPSGRLIQRDYKDVSLYDYLYNHKNPHPTEVKLTDSGRQVYGGGGITPDVVVAQPKPNDFQQSLLRRDVFFPFEGSVGNFTTYFLGTKPQVTKDFEVSDVVLGAFRRYLDSKNIHYNDADIAANVDWIKQEIKKEVFVSVFGLPTGEEVELENDPQVLKAIEGLPQARALYENARRVLAQRLAAPIAQP
ncbi:MAG: S41 family peptidase [Acidobacteria bacterium]|nr:MAG: S41 family peptidase [Acidobacteriota bacterium]